MNIRRFRAGNGLVLTLPIGLKSAPGATHLRVDEHTTFEVDLDDPSVRLHQRFITLELANGDLVDVTDQPAPASPPAAPSSPTAPAAAPGPFVVNP